MQLNQEKTKNYSSKNSIELGLYQHYKGNLCEVIGVAHFSEDPLQLMVVYKKLEACTLREQDITLEPGSLWVRPLEMFNEYITDANGNQIKRFKKV